MKFLINNLKNLRGWRSKRKIIVFAVDDYGNVRLASKDSRQFLDSKGLKVHSRFDALDTLETREDLEQLFDALASVKDKNGRYAVFTPFALPCNIDFEAITNNKADHYIAELLPVTFQKVSAIDPDAYQGTWQLWQEGMDKGIFIPQSHGREHLNIRVFNEKLRKNDAELTTCMQARSYTSISHSGYPTISYTAALDFVDVIENEKFKEIIQDGLNAFEQVFSRRAVSFNAPGGKEHPNVHQYLHESGIKTIDTPFIKSEHQGRGIYKKVINYTGKTNSVGQRLLVRNAVFEPTHRTGFDWVNSTLDQISAAFTWGKPAIISSHRVNFCGHINSENRTEALQSLRKLLKQIVKRWPDVEFMASNELGELIAKKNNS